ncbi:MAG: hypothetical protein AAF296_13525 [Pseudomonadota bacterium]
MKPLASFLLYGLFASSSCALEPSVNANESTQTVALTKPDRPFFVQQTHNFRFTSGDEITLEFKSDRKEENTSIKIVMGGEEVMIVEQSFESGGREDPILISMLNNFTYSLPTCTNSVSGDPCDIIRMNFDGLLFPKYIRKFGVINDDVSCSLSIDTARSEAQYSCFHLEEE